VTILNPGTQSLSQTGSAGAKIVGTGVGEGPGPEVMRAATLAGNKVVTSDGEHVGKVSEIMLDVRGGRIAYAVLSNGGGLAWETRCMRSRGVR
jgi:uncharacterized protein YrrD